MASQPTERSAPEESRPWRQAARAFGVWLTMLAAVAIASILMVEHGFAGDWADWVIVFALGASVGVGELVSRYRDAPSRALTIPPAVVYCAVNGLASVAALGLIRTFDLKLGVDGVSGSAPVRWVQLLAGGTGAMVLLRSSLFTVRAGGQDVAVGPAGFLQIILDASDRHVDRSRAARRSLAIKQIMDGVSFERALGSLQAYCTELMQNFPAEEGRRLSERLQIIANAPNVDDQTKADNIGLALMTAFGTDVLETAVKHLRDRIERQNIEGVAELVHDLDPSDIGRLPAIAFQISGRGSKDDLNGLIQLANNLDDDARVLGVALRLAAITGVADLARAMAVLRVATPTEHETGDPATAQPAENDDETEDLRPAPPSTDDP